MRDLEQSAIELRPGLVLTLYTDDEDDAGNPDEMRVEGVVAYNDEQRCWVASVDRDALRHASEADGRIVPDR